MLLHNALLESNLFYKDSSLLKEKAPQIVPYYSAVFDAPENVKGVEVACFGVEKMIALEDYLDLELVMLLKLMERHMDSWSALVLY